MCSNLLIPLLWYLCIYVVYKTGRKAYWTRKSFVLFANQSFTAVFIGISISGGRCFVFRNTDFCVLLIRFGILLRICLIFVLFILNYLNTYFCFNGFPFRFEYNQTTCCWHIIHFNFAPTHPVRPLLNWHTLFILINYNLYIFFVRTTTYGIFDLIV